MGTYQIIICCLVSSLLIRRDFCSAVTMSYVLYYALTDLLLQYELVFYYQQHLIVLDIITFNLTIHVLVNNKDRVKYNDIRLLITIGLTILIVHLSSIIDNSLIFDLATHYGYLNYYLTNWHLELLVLLLINVKVSELSLSEGDFNTTLKTVIGVTVILTITFLNYL